MKISKIFLSALLVVLLAAGVLLAVNKTFLHDSYAIVNEQGKAAAIKVLPWTFFVSESTEGTAVFYRFGDREDMQAEIYRYVESLTSCYDDGAFCDTEQDFTIYKYEVSEGFLLHQIALVYKGIDLKDIENATGKDLITLDFDGNPVTIMQGDDYRASMKGAMVSATLNGEKLAAPAVTGRGVALGNEESQVTEAYGISSDAGLWLTLPDGGKSLILAYNKEEAQWYLMDPEEIEAVVPYLEGETMEKPGEFMLIYRFDFPAGSGGLAACRIVYI